MPVGPGNVVIPVPPGQTAPDARVLLDGLLEKLITDAEVVDDVGSLPALRTFVVLMEREPAAVDWVVARVAREDVPWALAVGFADGLSPGRRDLDGVVHTVLIRHLGGEDSEARGAAVDVLKARGQFAGTFDRSCDCVLGTYSHAGASWTLRHGRAGEATTFESSEPVDTPEDGL